MAEKDMDIYLGYTTDKALTPFYRKFLSALDEKKLMKSVCSKCDTEYLPPREYCQKCMSKCELEEFTEREAKLYSYVIVDFPPETMSSRAPYVVGIGEFPSGKRLTAHITNLMSQPEVGMDLKLAFETVEESVDSKKVTYKWLV
jgi:hypothetical protein